MPHKALESRRVAEYRRADLRFKASLSKLCASQTDVIPQKIGISFVDHKLHRCVNINPLTSSCHFLMILNERPDGDGDGDGAALAVGMVIAMMSSL